MAEQSVPGTNGNHFPMEIGADQYQLRGPLHDTLPALLINGAAPVDKLLGVASARLRRHQYLIDLLCTSRSENQVDMQELMVALKPAVDEVLALLDVVAGKLEESRLAEERSPS
jgi:hypothetical protein